MTKDDRIKFTSAFRAANFELFTKPRKPIMIFGVSAFSVCVGYLGYMKYVDYISQKDEKQSAVE